MKYVVRAAVLLMLAAIPIAYLLTPTSPAAHPAITPRVLTAVAILLAGILTLAIAHRAAARGRARRAAMWRHPSADLLARASAELDAFAHGMLAAKPVVERQVLIERARHPELGPFYGVDLASPDDAGILDEHRVDCQGRIGHPCTCTVARNDWPVGDELAALLGQSAVTVARQADTIRAVRDALDDDRRRIGKALAVRLPALRADLLAALGDPLEWACTFPDMPFGSRCPQCDGYHDNPARCTYNTGPLLVGAPCPECGAAHGPMRGGL